MSFLDILRDPGKRLDFVVASAGVKTSSGDSETFYYSMAGRRDSATHANPSGVDMPPLLIDPGGHLRGLSADRNFGGISENQIDAFVLRNRSQKPEHLRWFQDYEFKDQALVLYGGERGAAWSTFEALHTTVHAAEPTVQPARALLHPASPLSKLRIAYPLPNFVGQETAYDWVADSQPTLSTSSVNANYDLGAMTVMIRLRLNLFADPSGVIIMRIWDGSSTFGTFDLYADTGTNNILVYRYPVSGSWGISTTTLPVGEWSTVIFSVKRNGEGYLAFDDVMVDEGAGNSGHADPIGNSNQKVYFFPYTGGLISATLVEMMDARIYRGYYDHDEALDLLADESQQTDPLIFSARFDDGTGTTATDYSRFSNHITNLNSASGWIASGEGDESMRGRPKVLALGEPRQVESRLISENWKQYELPVDDMHAAGSGSVEWRTQGIQVFDETDPEVDLDRGLVTVTTLEDEPTTCDLHPAYPVGSPGKTMPDLVETALEDLGITLASEYDSDSSTEYDAVIGRMQAGYLVEGGNGDKVIADMIGGQGAYLSRTNDGLYRVGFLLPPLSPTPLVAPCLDFRGFGEADYVSAANIDFDGDVTVMAWINTQNFHFWTTPGASVIQNFPEIFRVYDSTAIDLVHIGMNPGKELIVETYDFGTLQATEWTAVFDDLKESEWVFVAFVFTNGGGVNAVQIFAGHDCADFEELAVENPSASFFPTGLAKPPKIGYQWPGGIGRVLVRNVAMTKAQIQDFMFKEKGNIDPTSDTAIKFHAEQDEGEGSPTDAVSASTATLSGTRWDPEIQIHLAHTRSSIPEETVLLPSKRTIARFDRHWRPLTAGEVAPVQTGWTKTDQIDAQRDSRAVTLRRSSGVGEREFETNVIQGDRVKAGRLARLLDLRFRNKVVASIKTPYRPALVIEEGASAWLQGPVAGYNQIRGFRVARSRPRYGRLETELMLWGKKRRVDVDEAAGASSGGVLIDGQGNYLSDGSGHHLTVGTLPQIEA